MESKYRCQQCKNEFSKEKPHNGPCPKCGHVYISWLNAIEVLRFIHGEKLYPKGWQIQWTI